MNPLEYLQRNEDKFALARTKIICIVSSKIVTLQKQHFRP